MHELVARRLFERDLKSLTPRNCERRRWTIFSKDFPYLDIGFQQDGRRPLRLKFECRDYDMMPVSIELLEWDGTPLSHQLATPKNIFNMSDHPHTKRPFVCMAGAREYHQHESHVDDTWFNYRRRDGFNLAGIVYQIWSGWRLGQSL